MIDLMPSPTELLARISPLREVVGYQRAADFLRHPATQYHDGGGGNRVSVRQIDHAWGTRLLIAHNKGLPAATGSEHLVAAIKDLPNDAMLEGAIFASDREIAAFWFVETTGVPVGFVIVPRNVVDGVPVPL
jgi:hypothetical protein